MPDPATTTVTVNGTVQASDALLPSACAGYMHPNNASYTVALSDMSEAYIASCSSADTALALRGPNRHWMCDDDSEGSNPVVRIADPDGSSKDFVARCSDDTVGTATLNRSEASGPHYGGQYADDQRSSGKRSPHSLHPPGVRCE